MTEEVILWTQNIEGCPVTYEHTKEDGSKVNVIVGMVKSTDHDQEGHAHLSLDVERLKKLGVDWEHASVSVRLY